MKPLLPLLLSCIALWGGSLRAGDKSHEIVFGTFAEDESDLANIRLTFLSIRRFGGAWSEAPLYLYLPASLKRSAAGALRDFDALGVEIRCSETPADAAWFYLAGKVFAAALAERELEGRTRLLAWLGPDTIMLDEPAEFILPEGKALGYRPVMHRNIGGLWDEPLDAFWSRAYELMSVREEDTFPMITPADGDRIRPYFNGGCLIVRPERGTLGRWAESFERLHRDPELRAMCEGDVKHRIFIHQAALTGAIVNHLERSELLELSDRVNYPLFFQRMFGAKRVFNDLTGVVTLRHESYFRDPAPDWEERLSGPADRIAWIRENMAGG